MKKRIPAKSLTACAISAALLVAAAATASAAELEEIPVKASVSSQYTQAYRDYLDGTATVDENSGVGIAKYAVQASKLQPSSALPTSYKSQTTDIRDQGNYNTCWAFSAIGALETYLISDGKGSHDLSEQHLSWWTTRQYNSNNIGWLMNGIDSGGYSIMGAGYLASWQGAKLESDIPYYTSGNSMPSNMDTAANAYNVTGIVYVDNDITSVKTAVYQYGAVATSFNSLGGYNSDLSAYYQSSDYYVNGSVYYSGHAITIVGWDDNYSRNNFSSDDRPGADGAWLVKNSWGSDVGDDGYLWISYYDKYILDTNTWGVNYAITDARTANSYDKMYQNEEYGATYLMYLYDADTYEYCDEITYVNCFDFDSEHNLLNKVIFEAENQGASYTVYYIPVENNTPVSSQSRWTALASGTVDATGYVCVDTKSFSLPSGKGAIGVTVKTGNAGEPAFMGVDEWLTDSNGTFVFKPDQNRNESFIIVDGETYDLVDIYDASDDDIGGTLVIKALTTSNIIGDVNLDGIISVSDGIYVLRNTVGLTDLSADQAINADANYDDSITVADAVEILRKSAGIINSF